MSQMSKGEKEGSVRVDITELFLEELVEGGGVGMRMKQEQNVSRVSLTVSTMKNLCCAFVFCFVFLN